MARTLPPLPIDEALPELLAALAEGGQAVLQAPPGAGKTTRVPLALAERGTDGKILVLEPRRLAARAAAERMADLLAEPLGQSVGYRMRGEQRPGTRIEVVTEGILTRMIQSDPELPGVASVVFDEFHERSLQADLGLALAIEVRAALRPDLELLVMSATLDAAPVADLLGAPVVTSQGRSYPVDIRWLDRPLKGGTRREPHIAGLIEKALAETSGDVLVFLPGEGEIRRLAASLPERAGVAVRPLYGALAFADQRAAIAPCETGRKVVLATAIAETSLTIEGVTAVVDAGQSRRARFDPGSGMSRLVTERVSRAEATQRAGRAGRLGPGVAYRLWARAEEGGFAPFPPAEIEAADLCGLALELAAWGASAGDMAFLTAPPAGALAEAQGLLRLLGALDAGGRITDHGRAIARLPLHPRLAHMLLRAGPKAAPLAALLSDRDPMRGVGVDLRKRLRALEDGALPGPVGKRLRAEAKRLKGFAGPKTERPLEEALALAFPDRIGLRRPTKAPEWLLSGGRGAAMDDEDDLIRQRMIVAADLDAGDRNAVIRLALPISEAQVRALFADQIVRVHQAVWSQRDRRVHATQSDKLGAVALSVERWRAVPPEAMGAAMLEGVRSLGLRLSGAAARLAARVEAARAGGADLPAMDAKTLEAQAETWLLPFLDGVKSADDWAAFDVLPALQTRLGWEATQTLAKLAPGAFTSPLGRDVPIDYAGGAPEISVRLQEMFGVTQHPIVAGSPLKITLLSPAGRPVQVTTDLPGFWASSYADVRKDMRGRYPKHPWPEDPTQADPTLRTKRKS